MVTFLIAVCILAFFVLTGSLKIVPQREAYIVERLGKYHQTLLAGFHIIIPFIDRVAYKHSLKEQAIDVPSQTCITRDNISVEVDGIMYLQVMDPKNASYGIDNYAFASIQLAQTTMRSVIGKLELDKTFEERDSINSVIVSAVDKASDSWGIKITRYEVKNITPPQSIKDAMEKQMRAEREKRAIIAESEGAKQAKINAAEAARQELIAKSEGEMQAKINVANADKQELIARSEGEQQRRVNEAAGKASEIEQIARATATGLREIAAAIGSENGTEAVNLRIAEQYLNEFGKLAKENNTMIIPQNMTDVSSVLATAMSVIENSKKK
ncbi:MAG: paraslipin [Bacteroidales bacterium]|nr:paraslipin [Bacteroidales bacterium]MBQ3676472.1 paraslipin [Bacteroidales bacterium]MBR3979557.1 paraslipin [Bacteroidales bacterium]MBR4497812.1 paraslipin [Bacteroidales bacterium]MBR4689863.1 paraslipin [Bacteroidales bacterium]